jgi:hypothetical protein
MTAAEAMSETTASTWVTTNDGSTATTPQHGRSVLCGGGGDCGGGGGTVYAVGGGRPEDGLVLSGGNEEMSRHLVPLGWCARDLTSLRRLKSWACGPCSVSRRRLRPGTGEG